MTRGRMQKSKLEGTCRLCPPGGGTLSTRGPPGGYCGAPAGLCSRRTHALPAQQGQPCRGHLGTRGLRRALRRDQQLASRAGAHARRAPQWAAAGDPGPRPRHGGGPGGGASRRLRAPRRRRPHVSLQPRGMWVTARPHVSPPAAAQRALCNAASRARAANRRPRCRT